LILFQDDQRLITNEAREVVKVMLKNVISTFGVPIGISSDKGSHFVAEIVQNLGKIIGI